MPYNVQSANATQRASGYASLVVIAFAMPTTIIKRTSYFILIQLLIAFLASYKSR